MAEEVIRNQKKAKIKELVKELLKDREKEIEKKIDRALNSGCINLDLWDEVNAKMRIPKTIACAIMESEAYSFTPIGCSTKLVKQVKKDVKNIKLFI